MAEKAEQADNEDVGLQMICPTIGQFTNNFLKVVASDNPGNLITSPLSAQVVLAMAAYGAAGTTATQMRSVLLIPGDDELGQSGYLSLIELLNSVEEVELRLVNKIYTASQFAVKSTYRELTAKKFLSINQELDFNDPVAAATAINTWCEEQTNKRIKDVIAPDSLGPDTKLILVNAVYFKGLWHDKFDPRLTADRPFYVDEDTTIDVPTMFIENKFRFGDLPELDARFVEIPYKGRQLSMIIVLPNQVNGLEKVQNNLHQLNLSEVLKETWSRKIELFLPKFKIESTLNLNETLAKLGMSHMFGDHADFSGIADFPLRVSKVIQKAFIEVNEEGSEAAAVTMMAVVQCCMITYSDPPPIFQVDRPYHYTIYHRDTGVSLFTGIVQQPNFA